MTGGAPGVADLAGSAVREAISLWGAGPAPAARAEANRVLRDRVGAPQALRRLLDDAPPGARDGFVQLVDGGPQSVEDLLGRGWWGRGLLPAPLDWLQRRGVVAVAADGLVHAVAEAQAAFLEDRGQRGAAERDAAGAGGGGPLRVEAAATVVIASSPEGLASALAVDAARLRLVAPTVALSDRSPGAIRAALLGAGVPLEVDAAVPTDPDAPALPGAVEEASGPRAVRDLLTRAVGEGRQVRLVYYASSRGGQATDRVVDPWSFGDDLLRGYCHLRGDERAFAVDRIGRARLLASPVEHADPGASQA